MPSYVSPGVYTIEKDISDYTPSINTSIVGIVGFAGRGPTNKATLITSQNQLLRTFGNPNESITGQGLEGALEILEQTNSLYFVRASTSTATDASASMQLGTCPSVIVSGGALAEEGFGIDRAMTLRLQVYNNAGVAQYDDNAGAGRDFVIAVNQAVSGQAEALRKVIGGGLDADHVSVEDNGAGYTGLGLSGAIVGSYAGSGAYMSVSACTGSTFDATNPLSALQPVSALYSGDAKFGGSGLGYASATLVSATRVYGATFETTATSGIFYNVESIYEGAGYNGGTKTDGTTSGNSIGVTNFGGQNFNVVVNEDGDALETFKSSFVGSGAFLEDVINTGETNLKSDVIKGNIFYNNNDVAVTSLTNFGNSITSLAGANRYAARSQVQPLTNMTSSLELRGPVVEVSETTQGLAAGGNGPRWVKLVTSTNSLAGGSNGLAVDSANTTALIGNAAAADKTGMQALDDDTINIGIALVPGIATESVQNNLITLAERTQNFLAVMSPPYAIGATQAAIDWSNGKSSSTAGSRTSPINSSYAAIYWPWVKVFSVFDAKDRWFDPAIYGARQMCFTDSVADSWFAPAGFRRGRLTKPTEVEVKLNQGDRDSLYSGGNVINPVVSFPQQGITIFGQRTTQRAATALDRINIRRLMIYIRKVILASARRFVFEPNDEFTWAQIEGLLNPFLDDIRRRRGITEFRVVCDATVNTPVRVDRNELWTKVIVKPTKTAEMLIFEINLTNQSADLGTL